MANNPPTSVQPLSNGEFHQRAVEQDIREICAEVLGRPILRVKMHKSFLAHGGDSLLAVKLMARCGDAGYSISIHDILQSTSISELCRWAKVQKRSAKLPIEKDEQSALPLTRMQQLYISAKATKSKLFRLNHDVTRGALIDALEMLVDRNPMLQTRFVNVGADDYELQLGAQGRGFLICETCEIEADIETPRTTLIESIDALLRPPRSHLFAAVVFVPKGTSMVRYLGLGAAQTIVDANSWDILTRDIESTLNKDPVEGQHWASFTEWAQTESMTNLEWKYAMKATKNSTCVNGSIYNHQSANGVASGYTPASKDDGALHDEFHFDIDEATTCLLFDASIHRALRTDPRDFVVAAFYLTIWSINKDHDSYLTLSTIINARDGCDSGKFSSTIGCFDKMTTMVLEKGTVNEGDVNLLRRIKDSCRGYCEVVDEKLATTPSTSIADENFVLNLTNFQQVPASERMFVQEVYTQEQTHQALLGIFPIPSLVYIESFWAQDHLIFRLRHGHTSHHRTNFAQISLMFQSALSGLISRFQHYELNGTLSDFPSLKVTYAELDELISSQLRRITPDPLRDVEEVFPCSPIQEVFLIAQGINPQQYQCSALIRIKATTHGVPLDYMQLDKAWKHLVKRHASLRTVFIDSANRHGHFDQVVLKEGFVPIKYFDSDNEELSASDFSLRRPASFENYSATHGVAIYRSSTYSCLLRLDISHALVDGVSADTIFLDLSRFYASEGPAATVMQYRDFVSYQHQLSSENSIAYWSGYLAGAQPSFFPTNGDYVERRDFRTVRSVVDLAPETFHQFCSKFNITIANVCQVAWAIVLRSYAGSDDICFSYVSSGREAPIKGIDGAVGVFVDATICRVQMSGQMTIPQTLAKVKHDLIKGLSHPGIFMGHGTQSRDFSQLRGNTIMSYQSRASGNLFKGPGLEFEVLDAVNPSEVSEKLPRWTHVQILLRAEVDGQSIVRRNS
jgi:hypothetical protein